MVDPNLPSPMGKAARNERRRAFASTCNTVAVAFFVSALLQPAIGGEPRWVGMVRALVGFVALQGFLHYILARVED